MFQCVDITANGGTHIFSWKHIHFNSYDECREFKIPIEGEHDYEDGEMQLRVYRDPWRNSALGYQLMITADIQSFTSQMKILVWFGDVCRRIDNSDYGYVRQASISIETETLDNIITGTFHEDISTGGVYLLYTVFNRKTGEGTAHKQLLYTG